MNLKETVLVKDNHIKALLDVARLKKKQGKKNWVRYERKLAEIKKQLRGESKLIVEAENRKEIELALKSRADIILLDNMPPPGCGKR